MREYKSGTGWCVWRWTFTPSGYITRLHVIKTPWFAICLHWINGPDPEPYLHDHPITFLSIFLRGWYIEERQLGTDFRVRLHTWANWIWASRADRHTIVEVAPDGALTLCFMGPKTREWGFHFPQGLWVHWKAYNDRKYRGDPELVNLATKQFCRHVEILLAQKAREIRANQLPS